MLYKRGMLYNVMQADSLVYDTRLNLRSNRLCG